ncbi:MAG: hypothetical protein D3910_14510 [Candidatus Electrothrix sp. ATG2]|nr:hypothetical protein [Candidatus Electrothrix sp. ATG2]
MIEQAESLRRTVELFSGRENFEGMLKTIGSQLLKAVEYECGNDERRWKFPIPHRSLNLLIAGAEFQRTADSFPEHKLQNVFTDAADKFFQAGLKILNS